MSNERCSILQFVFNLFVDKIKIEEVINVPSGEGRLHTYTTVVTTIKKNDNSYIITKNRRHRLKYWVGDIQ